MHDIITRLARWGGRVLATLAVAALPAAAWAAHPFPIGLVDAAGNPVSAANSVPYSPDRSCGTAGCHDTALISQGYHFQQGRTNGAGYLNVSDTFLGALLAYDLDGSATKGTGAWWKLSDGMYGKW